MAIEKLKYETRKVEGQWVLVFAGALDEWAVLPAAQGAAEMALDMAGITHVNSAGLSVWVKWLDKQSARPRLILRNCPVILTKHFGLLRDLIPSNAVIESFFVPYFSDQSTERQDVLYRLGREYNVAGMVLAPKVLDSKGQPMELDVFADAYFGFLKK